MTDSPAPSPDVSSSTLRADDPARAVVARLTALRIRITALVEQRGAGDPTAADPLRGLYLSDEAVRHHLRGRPGDLPPPQEQARPGPTGESPGDDRPRAGDRLHRLALRLGLTELDTAALLIALAPDLDRGFEPLYGYLNDDVSRRRATVGLVLDVCGLPAAHAAARDRFHLSAPLPSLGLLIVEEPERPFLSRSLRVPDRLVAHLLGDETLDAALDGHLRPLPALSDGTTAGEGGPLAHRLAEHLIPHRTSRADPTRPTGQDLAAAPLTVYLRENREGDGLLCAATALRAAGYGALHYAPVSAGYGDGHEAGGEAGAGLDDHATGLPRPAPHGPVRELLREARLRGCGIVVSELPERPGPLIRALSVRDVPVLFTGTRPYDPQWSDGDPLVLEVDRLPLGGVEVWSAALGIGPADDPGFDLAATVAPYHLGGERIRRAARSALKLAAFEGIPLAASHLRRAARQLSASGLEQHARRIRPDVGWDDLVLPDEPLGHLRELALRARHRDRVLGEWRLSAGGGRGHGVLALFAGESGTGKTLSAEVVAADLGLDLYVVQLSSVVDKYVGETEKNLERVFTEADRTDAVLLFDEADAVFGKRSEVKGSHDRYANMESAYLLQRLEAFDGIALLTTNLRANIDDAFTRRLDLVVDFPFPDAGQRLALWRHSLVHVPCEEGIDLGPCAREFELAGGSIRSAVVTAAYAAADRGEPVTGADLLAGARREYRKAGRLVLDEVSW
ncbi:ATP-binding protein [Streptomyces sp. NPDC088116]|uniref:AAA family ATPase n=1 Tax=Streptomyces sp. NPDC088116 TaxID=3365825 RepID=UPI0038007631